MQAKHRHEESNHLGISESIGQPKGAKDCRLQAKYKKYCRVGEGVLDFLVQTVFPSRRV